MEHKYTLHADEIKIIWGYRPREKHILHDPILSEWLLLLRNYAFLYRTQKNRKTKYDSVLEETKILRGIIEHPHLSQPAKRRQFVDRYFRVSRAIIEPPPHKKALRWIFKKLDSLVNVFRKKKRFSLSAYFAPTCAEKLREKLEEKMYNRRRNSL